MSGLGDYGPLVLMAGIYFTTSLLTMFISNTATAVLVAPIALQSAIAINVSPYPVPAGGDGRCSMSFASPFSYATQRTRYVRRKIYIYGLCKGGVAILQIVMGIVMVFILPLLFPF